MEIAKSMIVDLDGNFCFTAMQDNTSLAKAITDQKGETKGWTEDRSMKKIMSVPPYVYQFYVDKFGSTDCWSNPQFLKDFAKMRPEFCI